MGRTCVRPIVLDVLSVARQRRAHKGRVYFPEPRLGLEDALRDAHRAHIETLEAPEVILEMQCLSTGARLVVG